MTDSSGSPADNVKVNAPAAEPGSLVHAYSDRWQPYRDPQTGEVVTITWAQVSAVHHAMRCVNEMRATVPPRQAHLGQDPPLCEDFHGAKSRALGRLLVDGKPLFEQVPPYSFGACDYEAWDRDNGEAAGASNVSNGDEVK